MRICSETHLISWHNKEFVQVISTELLLSFNPAASRRLVTILVVFQISAAFCSTMKHPVCIRPIVDALHFQTRSSRFQTQLDSVSFGKLTPFDLTPGPLAFSVHRVNRLGSFSTNSAAAATAETAVTAESFPKVLVCLLTVGQSIRTLVAKHPSQCSPSIVVVAVMIAATISDQHVLDFASWQWFRECIRRISLTCNNIQLQATKYHSTLQPQMTCLQMSQTSSNSSSSATLLAAELSL